MAFIDSRPKEHRGAAIIAVAVLQGAAIYGLIMGLGVVINKEVLTRMPTRDYPVDPPPPKPQVEPKPAKDPIITKPMADPEVLLVKDPVTISDDSQGLIGEFPSGGQVIKNPPPPPKPLFMPVGPKPLANPGSWFTADDYPASDIRRGNEGRATFLLSIDRRGKVTDCRITRSTGHARLDAATCKIATQRARFDPATDGSGVRVSGTYTNSISWVIPKQ